MKRCSLRTPPISRAMLPAVWYWPLFLNRAARMTQPLYSTGSETFSAEAAPRPPNSALQNDITGLPSFSRPVWMLLLTSVARILAGVCKNAEGLLGHRLSLDFRSAKPRRLCAIGAAGDRAVRRPLSRSRHG